MLQQIACSVTSRETNRQTVGVRVVYVAAQTVDHSAEHRLTDRQPVRQIVSFSGLWYSTDRRLERRGLTDTDRQTGGYTSLVFYSRGELDHGSTSLLLLSARVLCDAGLARARALPSAARHRRHSGFCHHNLHTIIIIVFFITEYFISTA